MIEILGLGSLTGILTSCKGRAFMIAEGAPGLSDESDHYFLKGNRKA